MCCIYCHSNLKEKGKVGRGNNLEEEKKKENCLEVPVLQSGFSSLFVCMNCIWKLWIQWKYVGKYYQIFSKNYQCFLCQMGNLVSLVKSCWTLVYFDSALMTSHALDCRMAVVYPVTLSNPTTLWLSSLEKDHPWSAQRDSHTWYSRRVPELTNTVSFICSIGKCSCTDYTTSRSNVITLIWQFWLSSLLYDVYVTMFG